MIFDYYEPLLALNLPAPDIDTSSFDWHRYNPRKNIERWGVSLTSLDGSASGVPDLDSLFEYNKLNGTQFNETSFKTPTEIYKKHFHFVDEYFDLGRSHIIKLGVGGFFPYHRDFDVYTFRLIYTIRNCHENNLVWIQNGNVLKLHDKAWYCVNTKMIHSVFSFFGCEFAVFNALSNQKAHRSLIQLLSVK